MAVQYTPTAFLSPADGNHMHCKKFDFKKTTSPFSQKVCALQVHPHDFRHTISVCRTKGRAAHAIIIAPFFFFLTVEVLIALLLTQINLPATTLDDALTHNKHPSITNYNDLDKLLASPLQECSPSVGMISEFFDWRVE